MLVCSTCKTLKEITQFYRRSNRPSGYQSQCKICCKKWVNNNKNNLNKYKKSYNKNRYKNDINFKLAKVLRARLNVAINKNITNSSAVRNLGCSIDELKKYLESKFQPGMTWNNWALKGWHIDHIEPLANFDLTKESEVNKACHYSNLIPMWSYDNLSKGKKAL